MNNNASIAVLGGSFNPPHNGHFCIAIAVLEALRPKKLLMLPSATPPHKTSSNLLPFDFRINLLQEALDHLGLSGQISICTIEKERSGPSYTIDSLNELQALYPSHRLSFVLGSEDLPSLPTWRQWQDLPVAADLVVLPRNAVLLQEVRQATRNLWPNAEEIASHSDSKTEFFLPPKGKLVYIAETRLEISSTDIRERWLAQRNIACLLPQPTIESLKHHATTVRNWWQHAATTQTAPRSKTAAISASHR